MIFEMLLIIFLLYVVYSIPSRNRRILLDNAKSKVDEILTQSRVYNRLTPMGYKGIISEHTKHALHFDEQSCIRSAIHICCHCIVEDHGEIFDRLEDRLLNKAIELGYYDPNNERYKDYKCPIK